MVNFSTYTLNHFGIVAGACNELTIAGIIDSLIAPDPQQKITTGKAIVSMIINGLGFSNRRLYLYPQFFENKPAHLLLGEGITPEDLNDDTIGRALDRVFAYGCTELFCHVAARAAQLAGVNRKFGHLDTSTFSVYGEYKSSDRAAIHITYGHSKEKRPDLKQIFLNLLVCSDGGVPLFMQALDGNSSDVTTFRKTVTEFKRGLKENLQEVTYWIADSAFYAEETIREVQNDVLWISRVPERIKECKTLIMENAAVLDTFTPLEQEGYSYRKHTSAYGGVKQRWLVVHSEQKEGKAVHAVKREVNNELKRLQKKAKKMQRKAFESEAEAHQSASILQKSAQFHQASIEEVHSVTRYKGRGRPSKTSEKQILYYARYSLSRNQQKIDLEQKKRSIFIIATNELSEKNLTDQEVFDHYKGQQSVERGFRFLKDPLFFASSLFLKKPERIVSLTMIMCLSLLVYSICERKLRMLLKEHGETILNQVNKPTQRPTLRWIFQLFEDVHYVEVEENGQMNSLVKNVRPGGETALRILGKNYAESYLLPQPEK